MDRLIEKRIQDIIIVKNKIDFLQVMFRDISWFHELNDIEKAVVFARFGKVMANLEVSQREIICLRYGFLQTERLTFKEIAEILKIEPKCVRNIFYDTVSKMKNSKILTSIRYGEIDYETLQVLKDPQFEEVIPFSVHKEEKRTPKIYSDIIVEDLDLSTRTFHCLKRQKINTLKEIANFYQNYGIKGFMDIRNFGKSSLNEILALLNEHGEIAEEVNNCEND